MLQCLPPGCVTASIKFHSPDRGVEIRVFNRLQFCLNDSEMQKVGVQGG